MVRLKTATDLFTSQGLIIAGYRYYFPQDTSIDTDILMYMNASFGKIQPIFGEFRDYSVDEDTVRNEYVKRAVAMEANSISLTNGNTPAKITLNGNNTLGQAVKSEKMDGVTTVFADGNSGGGVGGIGHAGLLGTLGLLSVDAALLLSRFIRKTYTWGTPAWA